MNSYCNPPKFAYEDIDSVIDVTDYCDYMVTWDIKDGFFHIPLKRDVIDFLGFEFDGQFYGWLVLPFWANFSPYYFCKILRPIYVDDFFLYSSRDTIEYQKDWALQYFS